MILRSSSGRSGSCCPGLGLIDGVGVLRKHSAFIRYAALVVDLLLVELNWFVWYKITSSPVLDVITEPSMRGKFNSWKTGTILGIVWIVLTAASRYYDSKRISTIFAEWWDAAKYLFSVTVVFIFFASVFLDVHLLSRGAFAWFYGTALMTLILERTVTRYFLRVIRARGFNYRKVLIVGAGKVGRRVAEKIEADPWLGYRIAGYLDDEKAGEQVLEKYAVLGTIDDLMNVVRLHAIDKLIVALPMRAYRRLEAIIDMLQGTLLDCSLVPDIYQFSILRSGIHDLDGLPLVDIVSTPIEGTDALLKRIADVVLSLIILMVASPVLLLVSIGVKLTSPGPLLFTQDRHGEGGRVFRLYKFRSMFLHREEENGPAQAKRDDLRVTRFGRILRRTSLDELPQFINVLKGDMSIVGPRPHAVAHDDYYKEKIEPYLQRMRIKPGITGWAQINGWRGETLSIGEMERRIEHDLEYLQNWDIWLDFKIILTTLYRGFVHSKAY